ncbi:MAG: Fe-S cluster assembly protein SufD [SAR202 cluster bacterium]|jgi:Fe-S cluster assembly protein SufD|nr:Fe-S cluster assembly protein SufD [SAR202 cluster bacterium]|tara:strand:+ start:652 stop:1995 length:1344 start_codon:yes stop_codon:yes gene_type:complete
MAQQTATQEQKYVEAWKTSIAGDSPNVPDSIRTLRESAIARFSELGFPTTRRGNEEWKYTDVRGIASAEYGSLVPSPTNRVVTKTLDQHIMGGSVWNRLVFVDGHWLPELSWLPSLPAEVTVISLAKAMSTEPGLVANDLAQHASYQESGFTALNTAFLQDGALIAVPDNVEIEEPIHLIFLSSGNGDGSVSHPRTLVTLGAHAKATVIESYGGPVDGPYLTNAVSEFVVGPGAHLETFHLQQHGKQANHIGSKQVKLANDSSFVAGAFDFGGTLSRNTLSVALEGAGSSCNLYGLYMTNDSQHVDNQVLVDHAAPHTTSRQLYKGVLNGHSRGVFHGSITVRQVAQKTDALQMDKNLLLSDDAEADTKPALWIYADDVKCGHGATCGKLDETAMFYLRSRGLDEASARRMLIHAFANEILDNVGLTPLRVHLEQFVTSSLRFEEQQ